jgi:desampylase
MTIRISRAHLDDILGQAAANPDREICGLLLGDGEGISAILPAANVADNPATRFELDPAVLLSAHRGARRGGAQVVGHYHSHPSGSVDPSPCDADMAAPDGTFWLIVAGGNWALWRTGTTGLHGRFVPETPVIMDTAPEPVLASIGAERQ